MCFGAKDETAEGKLVTREMRTSSPSGTAVTFSLRLSSGPRAIWECIPSCGGCQSLASTLMRVVHPVDRGRGFFVPPREKLQIGRSPGKMAE